MENAYEALTDKWIKEIQEDIAQWVAVSKETTSKHDKENCELRVMFLTAILSDALNLKNRRKNTC